MNCTWKELKEAFKKAGIKDEDEILFIDVGYLDLANFSFDEKEKKWSIWS